MDRSDYVMYHKKIYPNQDILEDIVVNTALSAIIVCLIVVLTYISKADKVIMLLNTNNQ